MKFEEDLIARILTTFQSLQDTLEIYEQMCKSLIREFYIHHMIILIINHINNFEYNFLLIKSFKLCRKHVCFISVYVAFYIIFITGGNFQQISNITGYLLLVLNFTFK